MPSFSLHSPAFDRQQQIPRKYTCDGNDINPPLRIEHIPMAAQSLALIVDDPDAPRGTWVHWVLWNIDPSRSEISEGSVPAGAVEGVNDFGNLGYGGPCPPSGTHRYFFRLYALDAAIPLDKGITRKDLEKAMKGHVLGQAELIGLYSRS